MLLRVLALLHLVLSLLHPFSNDLGWIHIECPAVGWYFADGIVASELKASLVICAMHTVGRLSLSALIVFILSFSVEEDVWENFSRSLEIYFNVCSDNWGIAPRPLRAVAFAQKPNDRYDTSYADLWSTRLLLWAAKSSYELKWNFEWS